jgi:hypothetical protein
MNNSPCLAMSPYPCLTHISLLSYERFLIHKAELENNLNNIRHQVRSASMDFATVKLSYEQVLRSGVFSDISFQLKTLKASELYLNQQVKAITIAERNLENFLNHPSNNVNVKPCRFIV